MNLIETSTFAIISSLLILILFWSKVQTLFRLSAFYSPFNILRIFLLLFGGVNIAFDAKIGAFCRVSNSVIVKSGAIIGESVTLGSGTVVSEKSSIGNYCSLYQTRLGSNSRINSNTTIFGSASNILEIGENCTIGHYNVLDGSHGLKIGAFVHISSPGVGIWTHSSIPNALYSVELGDSTYSQKLIKDSIEIDDNCWIGGGSIIYPGVSIGPRSVILPNSVVNRDVGKDQVVGGIPSKFIKNIDEIRT